MGHRRPEVREAQREAKFPALHQPLSGLPSHELAWFLAPSVCLCPTPTSAAFDSLSFQNPLSLILCEKAEILGGDENFLCGIILGSSSRFEPTPAANTRCPTKKQGPLSPHNLQRSWIHPKKVPSFPGLVSALGSPGLLSRDLETMTMSSFPLCTAVSTL